MSKMYVREPLTPPKREQAYQDSLELRELADNIRYLIDRHPNGEQPDWKTVVEAIHHISREIRHLQREIGGGDGRLL